MNHQAIYNTHPDVVSIDDTAGAMDANGNPVVLDQSLVDAEVARLQAEHDSQEYARNRATAYAPLGDQLDMQYHDSVTGSRTWLDHVEEIKARFPK